MTMISRKLISRNIAGYEVWREMSRPRFETFVIDDAGDPVGTQEIVDKIDDASDRIVTLEVAYTPDGEYIGNLKTADFLCREKGIKPEAIDDHKVCSIGFCNAEHKWYGWSHRAISGFGIGDVVSEGDCTASSGWTDEYLAEHPEENTSLRVGFRAIDLADAKRMAIAFAESVG